MTLKSQLHIGIDASNIRHGGGLTHLCKLLEAANPEKMGFNQITIWASKTTANKLPNRNWINKKHTKWTELSYPLRILCQIFKLPIEVKNTNCDVLFSPGGILSPFISIPTITISQNLLPFEKTEASRFGRHSLMYLKFKILNIIQSISFKKADGIIFLTHYAKNCVTNALKFPLKSTSVIPHGIEKRFTKVNNAMTNQQTPIKLLYISILMPYKHQYAVADAIYKLKTEGFAVEITFIGASNSKYGKNFIKYIRQLDQENNFINWIDEQPFEIIHQYYQSSDIFVFASSCENLPNILIEAMASGLAITCSDKGPMPEVLGDAGVYFNPESSNSIADAIRKLILNPEVKNELSIKASEKARMYSWEKCAHKTFEFIKLKTNKEI